MESDDKDFEQASIAASDHDHLVRAEQRIADVIDRINAHQNYLTGIAAGVFSVLGVTLVVIYYLVLPPINSQLSDLRLEHDKLEARMSQINKDQASADLNRTEMRKDMEQIRTDINAHRKQTEKGQ